MATRTPDQQDRDPYIQGPNTTIRGILGLTPPSSRIPEEILSIRDTVTERPTPDDVCLGCDGLQVPLDEDTLATMHIVRIR